MMNSITDLIKHHRLSQVEAAEIMDTTQPRISDLKKGKLTKFSVDTLLGMLFKLGHRFEFRCAIDKPSLTFNQIE